MTSLNGSGFSVTLLKATTSMLAYIDAPTDAKGWKKAVTLSENVEETRPVTLEKADEKQSVDSRTASDDTQRTNLTF
jgi:dihydroxyacetone kinase